MKRIAILGSTGSIGRSALQLISQHRNKFKVVALTAGKNRRLLEKQIAAFSPQIVGIADEKSAYKLKRQARYPCKVYSGSQGIAQVASSKGTDFVLSAIVGAAGLIPTLSAIRAGKTIGLANKETLVMAGPLVLKEAKKSGAQILPVDSEHSGIFQCVEGRSRKEVKRLILTASGGPFRNTFLHDLKNITPDEALRHPNWKMGKKITIDSATLMNKGFEVIEAYYLFGVPLERIDVLVHPQSIVHSIVEFSDNSYIAQLSNPDMRGPIAYALTYPRRLTNSLSGLYLDRVGSLTFKKPDRRRFPCLSLAYNALQKGGTMPAVLNAANEVAVHAFLADEIRFLEIPFIIQKTMEDHIMKSRLSLPAILAADSWARLRANEIIQKKRNKS